MDRGQFNQWMKCNIFLLLGWLMEVYYFFPFFFFFYVRAMINVVEMFWKIIGWFKEILTGLAESDLGLVIVKKYRFSRCDTLTVGWWSNWYLFRLFQSRVLKVKLNISKTYLASLQVVSISGMFHKLPGTLFPVIWKGLANVHLC